MMFLKKSVLMLLLCLLADAGTAQDSTCGNSCTCASRPDFHAPIGVMLDHGHDKGQWMVSYRYMNMAMRGSLQGVSPAGNDEVYKHYIMSPGKMTMDMHMLMLMYGLSDRITLMGMATYVSLNMGMQMSMYGMMNMNGMDMSHMSMADLNSTMTMYDHSNGLGDSRLYVLYRLLRSSKHELLFSNGLNLPTGSTSLSGSSMGTWRRKPYAMQLGAGTYAWLPGLTYTGSSPRWSWGMQASGMMNLGYNASGYRTGNSVNATSWLAYSLAPWISVSARAEGNISGKIDGYDKAIAPYRTTDPMADVSNSGGKNLAAYAGLNLLVPNGRFKANRFSVEYGVPAYQYVNGIQMNTKAILYAGWQYSF